MSNEYEVLSPWAEVDPMPLRGIQPRVADLAGKTIGLFANAKGRSRPMLQVVEQKLKERFPTAKFSWYVPREVNRYNVVQIENEKNKPVFEEWVKGVDTVVTAVGD